VLRLLARWGIGAQHAVRVVQAPPGVPVATLVARGDAEVGFQQTSELLPVPGIEYVGPLPPEVQRVSVFAAGVPAPARNPAAAAALIRFLASASAADAVTRTGLERMPH
jgi:molybdate transport system substrate-binding protein